MYGQQRNTSLELKNEKYRIGMGAWAGTESLAMEEMAVSRNGERTRFGFQLDF